MPTQHRSSGWASATAPNRRSDYRWTVIALFLSAGTALSNCSYSRRITLRSSKYSDRSQKPNPPHQSPPHPRCCPLPLPPGWPSACAGPFCNRHVPPSSAGVPFRRPAGMNPYNQPSIHPSHPVPAVFFKYYNSCSLCHNPNNYVIAVSGASCPFFMSLLFDVQHVFSSCQLSQHISHHNKVVLTTY